MAGVAFALLVAPISQAVGAGAAPSSLSFEQPLQDHCEDCLQGQTSLLQVNADLRSRGRSGTTPTAAPTTENGTPPTAAKEEFRRLPSTTQCSLVLIVQYLAFLGFSHVAKGVCWSKSRLLRAFSCTEPLAALLPVAGLLLVTQYTVTTEMTGRDRNPAIYGLPQWWACMAMVLATTAGVAAMLFQFTASACQSPDAAEEELKGGSEITVFVGCLLGCRWMATAFQFIGLATAVSASLFLQQPYDVWLTDGRVWLSFLSTCTLGLLVQLLFFHGIGLLGAEEIVNDGVNVKVTAVAAQAQVLGPTICVLFLAARFRLLDLYGQVRDLHWPETFFYACVYGLLAQTVLACITAALSKERGWSCGTFFLRALEFLSFLAVLVGIVGVVTSFFYAKLSDGWYAITTPVSRYLACILAVVLQHTCVQLVAFLSRGPSSMAQALLDTSSVCPMLGVLFLAALVRACQISPEALPQIWVHTCTSACALASILNMLFAAMSTQLAKNEDQQEGPGNACLRLGVGCSRACSVALLGTSALGIVHGISCMDMQNVVVKFAY